MPRPEQAPPTHATQVPERGAALVLCPVAATVLFYCSPITFRQQQALSVSPPTLRICSLLLWGSLNRESGQRLGVTLKLLPQGLRWGLGAGLLLGSINALVILYLVPHFGGEYRFLAETPHAKIPMWIMLPWFIGFIAVMVELNFRGFLLGRLLALKLSPSHRPFGKRTAVCVRSLSGGNLSAAPLDCRLGRAGVGERCGSHSETFISRSWPMQWRSWCCML